MLFSEGDSFEGQTGHDLAGDSGHSVPRLCSDRGVQSPQVLDFGEVAFEDPSSIRGRVVLGCRCRSRTSPGSSIVASPWVAKPGLRVAEDLCCPGCIFRVVGARVGRSGDVRAHGSAWPEHLLGAGGSSPSAPTERRQRPLIRRASPSPGAELGSGGGLSESEGATLVPQTAVAGVVGGR